MTDNKVEISILYGEKEELYTFKVSPTEYNQIMNGDENILKKLVTEEREKRSVAMIQQLADFNDNNENLENLETVEEFEGDDTEENKKKVGDAKDTFTWPEKAVMLFLELYREREQEFNSGHKRHNKIWSSIALEMKNSNYNVSGVQVQNKMSSLKRTYKKIKDSNAKTGNHNSTWAFYSTMDSIFGDKGWVSPPAVASSEGPSTSSTTSCSSPLAPQFQSDIFEYQNISSCKAKKRKVEMILESFITDIKNDKDQLKEERKKELLEREEKCLKRWEINRAERKQMHKETSEIQKSLINVLQQLVQQQSNPK